MIKRVKLLWSMDPSSSSSSSVNLDLHPPNFDMTDGIVMIKGERKTV